MIFFFVNKFFAKLPLSIYVIFRTRMTIPSATLNYGWLFGWSVSTENSAQCLRKYCSLFPMYQTTNIVWQRNFLLGKPMNNISMNFHVSEYSTLWSG